jgi:hypothetical protein
MPVVPPLHIVWPAGLAVSTGFGLTVMMTFVVEPLQPPAVAVTVYVAVPDVMPEFVNACDIGLPLPSLAPVTPLWLTVHAKVEPPTSDVKAIEGKASLHIVWLPGVAITAGRGLTVITTLVPVPGQLLALGVT